MKARQVVADNAQEHKHTDTNRCVARKRVVGLVWFGLACCFPFVSQGNL